MSKLASGGVEFHHRARLFPIPRYQPVGRPPVTTSARVRARFKASNITAAITNNCIGALNRMYASPSFTHMHPFVNNLSSPSRPDNTPSSSTPSCSTPPLQDSIFVSAAQQRVLGLIQDSATTFAKKVRTQQRVSSTKPGCDILAEVARLTDGPASHGVNSHTHSQDSTEPLSGLGISLPPSSFSSSSMSVVPLVANRVALPDQLNIVPMLNILPPHVTAAYQQDAVSALLRDLISVQVLNHARPLKKPRINGPRAQYVILVKRLLAQRMLAFTSEPKAVNGIFTVAKDDTSDRLIIDAQPANRLFVDSPAVALPNPSHLVQLQVPKGEVMFTGKSDLSNYYHHIGLPEWMQPYFALPPLTPTELLECGQTHGNPYPMCRTMPMGFSHAVFIAQTAHQHIVYSAKALDPQDDILELASPMVSHARAVHGIVIDDFFLFCLDRGLAERILHAVLNAYREAGFVVKQSKVVMPTSVPVKVIGFEVDGAHSNISLPADGIVSLLSTTLRALRAKTVSGTMLSHIIGRWTWVMMLRRPTLSILQHVYRYIGVAGERPFTLWSSVRRELVMLVSVMPLLHCRIDAPFFYRAVASDASSLAGGVVVTPLTPSLHETLWPLCSSRHHAVQQAISYPAHRNAAASDDAASALAPYAHLYSSVGALAWRTIISTPWSGEEHINLLELRAALLALHWVVSHPSSRLSRVYLLLDSMVAFFTLWKGRSSSPKLLLVLRKINALILASGMSLLPGWLPSEVNPADAPSRLQGVHHTSAAAAA